MEKGSNPRKCLKTKGKRTLDRGAPPMYDPLMPSSISKKKNSRTRTRTFRISHTQFALLSAPVFRERASPLVRVLLHLYLNKKLDALNIEELVNEELGKSKAAELNGQEKIKQYNEARKRGDS